MRHRERGLPASLLIPSSGLYDEFEVVRVEDHAPEKKTGDDREIFICASCRRACCWLGIFYCDDYKTADLIKTTVGAHRATNPNEHEDYYTTEYDKAVGR